MYVQKRYLWLDGARGIAALTVVIYHLADYTLPGRLFRSSYLAVDLFFMMSGFVLAHAYERKLLSGSMPALRFIEVRLVRLYPLYLSAICAGFAYYLLKIFLHDDNAPRSSDVLKLFVFAAAFLPNPELIHLPSGSFPLAPSSWSLCTELLVNIAYGLVLYRLNKRWIALIAVGAGIVTLWMASVSGTTDMGWAWNNLGGGVVRTIASFCAGVVLYRIPWNLDNRWAGLSALGGLVLVALSLSVLPRPSIFVEALVMFGLFPIFIALSAGSEPQGHLATFCHQSGRFSYAIYILHGPLFLWLAAAYKFTFHRDPQTAAPLIGWLFVTIIVVVSCISTILFDEPCRRAIILLIKRRRLIEQLASSAY